MKMKLTESTKRERRSAGFSLLELLVALAVFMIIAGAAFTLVKQHMPLFTRQQNQASLNIAMRNIVAQMQIDAVNAGTGFYQGTNIATWPIGVTIINHPVSDGNDCRTSSVVNGQTVYSYGANCFDQLNIIAIDQNAPPAHPDSPGADMTNSSILTIVPTSPTTVSQLAAAYKKGDEVMIVSADGKQMTTTILTHDGQAAGSKVQLQHNPTGAGGENCTASISCSADPLGISSTGNNKIGTEFDTDAWVLKLSPIQYWVDITNPQAPKLMRTAVNPSTGAKEDIVMADQIIGFKVGASLRNGAAGNYLFNACLDTATCDYSDFSSIRSILVSVIARTSQYGDVGSNYRNSFDGGAYHIESANVVINPRNLMFQDQP